MLTSITVDLLSAANRLQAVSAGPFVRDHLSNHRLQQPNCIPESTSWSTVLSRNAQSNHVNDAGCVAARPLATQSTLLEHTLSEAGAYHLARAPWSLPSQSHHGVSTPSRRARLCADDESAPVTHAGPAR